MQWFTEHWPYLLIAFGGFCAVVGSFAAATKQSRFEAEMRAQAAENLKKTGEAIASITGGDSFVRLIEIIPPTRERFYVWLESEGSYAVHDVQFKIEDGTAGADYLKAETAAGKLLDDRILRELEKYRYVLKLGNVAPSSIVKNVFEFTFPATKTAYGFNYEIQARNGIVKGYLDFVRNTKGAWYVRSHKAWKNGEVLTDVTNEVPDMAPPASPGLPPPP